MWPKNEFKKNTFKSINIRNRRVEHEWVFEMMLKRLPYLQTKPKEPNFMEQLKLCHLKMNKKNTFRSINIRNRRVEHEWVFEMMFKRLPYLQTKPKEPRYLNLDLIYFFKVLVAQGRYCLEEFKDIVYKIF